MTDRYFAITVLLEKDIREDDAQAILNAILMIKGVAKVEPHVSSIEIWAAQERARQDLAVKLWEVIHPKD